MANESNSLDVITLDCVKCHLETAFPHEGLEDQTPISCSHCGADHGTWGSLSEVVSSLIESLTLEMGGETFDDLPGFTLDKLC
jgi:hypothetical protein